MPEYRITSAGPNEYRVEQKNNWGIRLMGYFFLQDWTWKEVWYSDDIAGWYCYTHASLVAAQHEKEQLLRKYEERTKRWEPVK